MKSKREQEGKVKRNLLLQVEISNQRKEKGSDLISETLTGLIHAKREDLNETSGLVCLRKSRHRKRMCTMLVVKGRGKRKRGGRRKMRAWKYVP